MDTIYIKKRQRMDKQMIRIFCTILGSILCLIGIIGMLTPIPFGIFVFVFGLLFLIPASPAATRAVRWVRSKIGLLDRMLTAITIRLPVPYRRVLRRTEVNGLDW